MRGHSRAKGVPFLCASLVIMAWTQGDPVVVGRGIGFITSKAKYPIDAWYVSVPPETNREGTGAHLMQEWQMHKPVLGVNICLAPRGKHFCGLVHLPEQQLAWLRHLHFGNVGPSISGVDSDGNPSLYIK